MRRAWVFVLALAALSLAASSPLLRAWRDGQDGCGHVRLGEA